MNTGLIINKILSIYLVSIIVTACASQSAGNALVNGGTLVWSDEFEGDSLDPAKWNIETGTGAQYGLQGWGNFERQFYKPQNVIVKNGCLYLEARMDNDAADSSKGEFPYTSGKITTGGIMNHDGTVKSPKFNVLPGMRMEARIKSSRGAGFWPAFWLLGTTSNYHGGEKKTINWPRCGEIDVVEVKGGAETRVNSTIHYGPYWPENKFLDDYLDLDNNLADDWHIYGVTWDTDVLHFLFDGKPWQTINLKQLNKDDKKYYIKEAFGAKTGFVININLSVGGQYIANILPDDSVFDENAPYEDRCFMVDWIRVYK